MPTEKEEKFAAAEGFRDMRARGFAFVFTGARLIQQRAEHDRRGPRDESQRSNLHTPKRKRPRFAVFSFITRAPEVNSYEL
jgi:hypothetical protein